MWSATLQVVAVVALWCLVGLESLSGCQVAVHMVVVVRGQLVAAQPQLVVEAHSRKRERVPLQHMKRQTTVNRDDNI